MRAWFEAAAGKLEPFILVLEGSVPNEEISGDGLLGDVRRRPDHRRADPDLHAGSTGSRRAPPPCSRSARARRSAGSRRCGTTRPARWACATTSAGAGPRAGASRSSTCPAARSSPTTSPRRCCSLGCTSRGAGPMIELDEHGRPRAAVRPHRAAGLRPRRLRRAGRVRRGRRPTTAAAWSSSAARARWSTLQRPDPRLGRRHRRLPERGRDLHGVHDARASPTSSCRSWSPNRARTARGAGGAVHLRAGVVAPAPRRPRDAAGQR